MRSGKIVVLKLRGLPELQFKERPNDGPGLHLKMRDDDPTEQTATGQGAGIKGLPGIYLEGGENHPYGIPGLPGIYTGGESPGSGLKMKTREDQAAAQQSVPPPPVPPAASPANPFDPSKMTPQQMADVLDAFSKLPPEEQRRLMAAAQQNATGEQLLQPHMREGPAAPPALTPLGAGGQTPAGMSGQPNQQALVPLQQQATASQAAAQAPVIEDASAQARAGFDQPTGQVAAVALTGTTPALLRPQEAPFQQTHTEPPSPVTSVSATAAQSGGEASLQYLFPATPKAPSVFPANPNPRSLNPLQVGQETQREFRAWDAWALDQAVRARINLPEEDPLDQSMSNMLSRQINSGSVKQYAPELLARYNNDAAFRASVDQRLAHANELLAMEYYQGIADAHKAAILAFQAEIDKLTDAGKLQKLVSLADQFQQHPELEPMVEARRARITADEQAAIERSRAEVFRKLDKEYQVIFQIIRSEAAQR